MTRDPKARSGPLATSRNASIAIALGVVAVVLAGAALVVTLISSSGNDASACRTRAWNAIPTTESLPDGWSLAASGFSSDGYSASFVGQPPADGSADAPGVFVRVTCYGADGAQAMRLSREAALEAGALEAPFAQLGDESFALQDPAGGNAEVYVRRGPFIAYVASSGPVDLESLEQAAGAVDDALVGAQAGVQPSPRTRPSLSASSPSPAGSTPGPIGAGGSASPGAAGSGDPAPSGSDDPGPDGSEEPAPIETDPPLHEVPALEAVLPKQAGGVTLSIESYTGSVALADDPSSQALIESLGKLGKTQADLKIGAAGDPTGTVDLGIYVFQVPGVEGSVLRKSILDSWQAVETDGLTSSDVTIGGKPAVKVTYGDGSTDGYLYVHDDLVFYVLAPDEALTAQIVAGLP